MKRVVSSLIILVTLNISGQVTIPLYHEAIPQSIPNKIKEVTEERDDKFYGYRNVSTPTLEIYLPDHNDVAGAAVIICPGGGYIRLVYNREGIEIAESFLRKGIAAFILKYRLPSDSIMQDKSIGPLQDAQQAIKIVRQHAAEWNLDTGKIGIMGFSAGGHLASTAGTHFEKSYIRNNENINLRPDFMILIYPVISMVDEITHETTKTSLLGNKPGADLVAQFSNELNINRNTPPTWLTHAGDDTGVPVENSIRFYKELIRYNVPAEMHLYPAGGHGFVLTMSPDEWMQCIFEWMKRSGIIQ
jgi:acetyl esterase/lipase